MTKNQEKAPKKPKPKKPKKVKTTAIVAAPPPRELARDFCPPHKRARSSIDPLTGDLPGVTLRNTHEVLAHFERIDPRLADAWRRDVVVHEGPITLRRIMYPASFGGATHYAYVDRRLLWYLRHDPSDPIGAHWDGYLSGGGDAPPGTIAVAVGRDIVVKKITARLMTKDLPDNKRCPFHSRAWGCRCDKPIGHDDDCVSMGDAFTRGWDPQKGPPGGPEDQAARTR